MHTIDLLKGEGVPAKTTLGSICFVAVVAAVPIIVASVMLGMYLLNNVNLDMAQGVIAKSEEQIAESEPDVKITRALEDERNLLAKRLKEVSRCVDTFVQWSPIMIAMSVEMPKEMIMNQMQATSAAGRAATGRKDKDPNKPVDIPMPKRTITFDIHGNEQGSFYTTVQDFQNSLELSAAFNPKFKAQEFSVDTSTGDNPIENYSMRFESQTQ